MIFKSKKKPLLACHVIHSIPGRIRIGCRALQFLGEQKEEIENNKLPEINGLYDIISIDPPWNYGRKYDPDGSRVANPYPEMSNDDIKKIKLPLNDESQSIISWIYEKANILDISYEEYAVLSIECNIGVREKIISKCNDINGKLVP